MKFKLNQWFNLKYNLLKYQDFRVWLVRPLGDFHIELHTYSPNDLAIPMSCISQNKSVYCIIFLGLPQQIATKSVRKKPAIFSLSVLEVKGPKMWIPGRSVLLLGPQRRRFWTVPAPLSSSPRLICFLHFLGWPPLSPASCHLLCVSSSLLRTRRTCSFPEFPERSKIVLFWDP